MRKESETKKTSEMNEALVRRPKKKRDKRSTAAAERSPKRKVDALVRSHTHTHRGFERRARERPRQRLSTAAISGQHLRITNDKSELGATFFSCLATRTCVYVLWVCVCVCVHMFACMVVPCETARQLRGLVRSCLPL